MSSNSDPLRSATESPLPAQSSSLWQRVANTSLGELLRGRLSGDLDLRRVVDKAELPEPLPGLIYRSALAAGGTRRERAWLARALADRCQADLRRGAAPAEVATQFASPVDFGRFIQDLDRSSLFWLLVHTPLSDVLRGRLTGSFDIRRMIQTAGLSQPVAETIRLVARRARLWTAEERDVTEELSEHFRDGLAAGRSAEELAASFGDARNAARLIRRAKLRCRPWPWRAWRRVMQITTVFTGLMVCGYLFLLARYFISQPRLSHNYALELSAAGRNVPEDQRAWPFYRAALLNLAPLPKVEAPSDGGLPPRLESLDVAKAGPDKPNWDIAVAWLEANQKSTQLTREGAARAQFGFVYGDPDDRAWLIRENKSLVDSMSLTSNEPLISLPLPHIQDLRRLTWLLDLDARRVIELNDGDRFVADVSADIAMAGQVRRDMPLLINYLVAKAIFCNALELVDGQLIRETRADATTPLTEAQWQALAHRIAAYGPAELRPPLEGERMDLLDFYQRIYSDDGHGDGRLTRAGAHLFRSFSDAGPLGKLNNDLVSTLPTDILVGPAALAVFASRREITALTEDLFEQAEHEVDRPLWQWNSKSPLEATFHSLSSSKIDRIRYRPLLVLMPWIRPAAEAGEWTAQRRDAMLTAIALTIFHRQRGAWPTELSQLVPDLLPKLLPDRFTGQPLSYRLVDGQPLLYSVGPDRKDDDGVSFEASGTPQRSDEDRTTQLPPKTYRNDQGQDRDYVGDWVLWPPTQPAGPAR